MALSVQTQKDMKEYLIYRAKDAGKNPLDADVLLQCLYVNWETAIDNTAMQAQLVTDRQDIQDALNAKKKTELEAQGYTVTDPV